MSRYRSPIDKYYIPNQHKSPNQSWFMGGYGFEARQERIKDRVNRLNCGLISAPKKSFTNLYRMISQKNSYQAEMLIEIRSIRNN